MWRRHSPLPLIVATIFVAATRAATSCFQNDPPYQIVRGQPFVLTWEILTDNSVFDLSLATEEHESLGYLARNVTESSLIWTPPLNITSEQLTFGLFWYDRQSMCYSPNFTVTGSPDASFATPSALLATTIVTNNRIASTVVATQGIWTPNDAALATATPTPTPSSAVLVQSNSSDSATDPWKIGVAVAISVLVLVVLILGGFLWRARRKRRDTVAAQEANDKQDTKLKYENDSYRSSAHTAVDELDGSNRNELPASERAQLDGRTMAHGWKSGMEYTELNGHERYEADSHNVVAELPGDEPVVFPEKRKEG